MTRRPCTYLFRLYRECWNSWAVTSSPDAIWARPCSRCCTIHKSVACGHLSCRVYRTSGHVLRKCDKAVSMPLCPGDETVAGVSVSSGEPHSQITSTDIQAKSATAFPDRQKRGEVDAMRARIVTLACSSNQPAQSNATPSSPVSSPWFKFPVMLRDFVLAARPGDGVIRMGQGRRDMICEGREVMGDIEVIVGKDDVVRDLKGNVVSMIERHVATTDMEYGVGRVPPAARNAMEGQGGAFFDNIVISFIEHLEAIRPPTGDNHAELLLPKIDHELRIIKHMEVFVPDDEQMEDA